MIPNFCWLSDLSHRVTKTGFQRIYVKMAANQIGTMLDNCRKNNHASKH
jgi:hypothetical protein